jgi:transcriptional regulator with XRE-family HTH domain
MNGDITELVRAGSRHTSALVLARTLRKMTQKELEDAAGLPRRMITRYESGTRLPDPATRERLAMALGVPADVLFPNAAWFKGKR